MNSLNQPQFMPAPDAYVRVILKETKSSIFGMVLVTFSICALTLVSAVYWFILLHDDGVPSAFSAFQIKLGAGLGVISPLALPYCIGWIQNPPCLIIDNDGIELRKPGQTRRLAWQDMREIKTDIIRDTSKNPINGTGTCDSYTVTVVKGSSQAIVITPDLGVPPTDLTAYLVERHSGACNSSVKLSDMNRTSAQKLETKAQLLNSFRLVVFGAALLGVSVFVGFLVWARMALF